MDSVAVLIRRVFVGVVALLLVGGVHGPSMAAARGWFVSPTPNPPGGRAYSFSAVSSDGARGAWAVGSIVYGSGYGGGFIEHRTHGRWSLVPAAVFPHSRLAWLTDVIAISPRNAWAVGSVPTGGALCDLPDSNGCHALVEHWNGRAWTAYPIGLHPGGLNEVARVPHTTHLWAVGGTARSPLAGGTWGPPLIAHSKGQRWTFTRLPTRWPNSQASSVAAVADNNVWVFGDLIHQGPASDPKTGWADATLTWHWNGHHWDVTRWPSPPPAESPGLGVAAVPGTRQLWAYGSITNLHTYSSTTLTERYTHGRWQVIPSPNCAGASSSQLAALAAIGPSDVWAVGTCYRGIHPFPLTEHYDGHHWHIIPAPTPGLRSELGDVTGVPRKGHPALWAVGDASPPHGLRTQPLALLRR